MSKYIATKIQSPLNSFISEYMRLLWDLVDLNRNRHFVAHQTSIKSYHMLVLWPLENNLIFEYQLLSLRNGDGPFSYDSWKDWMRVVV